MSHKWRDIEMRFLRFAVIAVSIMPAIALAAEATGSLEGDQMTFVREHSGLVVTIFALAVILLGFFLHRTLKQNDEHHKDFKDEIKALWEAYGVNDKILTGLHAEHELIKNEHRRRTDPEGVIRVHGREENGHPCIEEDGFNDYKD